MEQAIRKSIEGGYKWDDSANFRFDEIDSGLIVWRNESGSWLEVLRVEQILLDPSFWRCLGQSLGWKKYYGSTGWKHHWHCFIDHLIAGKDAESFLDTLISKEEKRV